METKNKKENDSLKISENWPAQSKQLQKKYPELTETDLKFESGKENELITRLESRLHKNREEVIGLINKSKVEKV